jgi:DNA-binding XRE family transcriptional regulator/tetratricopeptide (TPR) repeat protein
LGELVRAVRTARHLSQEELAAKAALDPKTLRNVESGKHRPQWSTVERLAEALGLDEAEVAGVEAAWRAGRRVGRLPPLAAPCALPRGLGDFVGRPALIGQVRAALGRGPRGAVPGVSPVCVVSGMAGAGKTALAVQLAHGLAADFPDGRLFLRLRGTADPVAPAEALARLLGRLGVTGRLPSDVDSRGELLRERVAGRRVLFVLDDAADERQVEPLLPAEPGSAVLVTCRSRLPGLAGARVVEVGGFEPAEALALLAEVVGARRIDAEPRAATRLVELCGRLPLAVRIIAAVLAGRREVPLAEVAGQLADERRLVRLRTGDLSVAASLACSYAVLPAADRRALRALACLDVPDFAAWLAAAALDLPLEAGQDGLDRLVAARLLEDAGADAAGQLRYRFHELVRVYARHEPGLGHDPDVRLTAARAAAATARLVEQATLVATGPPAAAPGPAPDMTEPAGTAGGGAGWPVGEALLGVVAARPLAWLEAESGAVVALVRQAAAEGLAAAGAAVLSAMTSYWSLRCDYSGWRAMAEAVESAARAGDQPGPYAEARLALAELALEQGDLSAGAALASSIVDIAVANGWTGVVARARLSIAMTARGRGDLATARVCYQEAITAAAGDRRLRGHAHSELATVHRRLGDLDAADRDLAAARRLLAAAGDARGAVKVRLRQALVRRDRGDLPGALDGLREVLAAARELGDDRAVLEIQYQLACLLLAAGAAADAAERLRPVVAASRRSGDMLGQAYASEALGDAYAALGRDRSARRAFRTALDYYRRVGDTHRAQDLLRRRPGLRSRLDPG